MGYCEKHDRVYSQAADEDFCPLCVAEKNDKFDSYCGKHDHKFNFTLGECCPLCQPIDDRSFPKEPQKRMRVPTPPRSPKVIVDDILDITRQTIGVAFKRERDPVLETFEKERENLAPKFNVGKPRIHLCPPFLRNMMISALEYGCRKYFENSWRQGFFVSDMYSAANRHLDAFFHEREDIDEESQCHHLDCAIFNVAMMRYSVDLEGMDNRPPVTPDQIAEVIRLGMIELQKRKENQNGTSN